MLEKRGPRGQGVKRDVVGSNSDNEQNMRREKTSGRIRRNEQGTHLDVNSVQGSVGANWVDWSGNLLGFDEQRRVQLKQGPEE